MKRLTLLLGFALLGGASLSGAAPGDSLGHLQTLRLAALKRLSVDSCPSPQGAPGAQLPPAPPLLRDIHIEHPEALRTFHEALGRLVTGEIAAKVRILAYGASHTQADFYTGYLRSYFQSRFGNGGQGFVFPGRVNAWHRPFGVDTVSQGFKVTHGRSRIGIKDEPLGLFGAALDGRYQGSYGELGTFESSKNTRYELHYLKQRSGGMLLLRQDKQIVARINTRGDTEELGVFAFESAVGAHTFRVEKGPGGPARIFGIVAESSFPGVVVDTLGIGGARMADNLRWDEDIWIQSVQKRNPDLVTFAYGTNEAMPGHSLLSYERDVWAVLERFKKAAPKASCLLVGPFDLLHDKEQTKVTRPRLVQVIETQRKVAAEFGCGFWDGYAFMGGEGAIHRWVVTQPPLASTDHVHLTLRGYACTGLALGDALLASYDEQGRQGAVAD